MRDRLQKFQRGRIVTAIAAFAGRLARVACTPFLRFVRFWIAGSQADETARVELAAIVDVATDAIHCKDAYGVITRWSRGAERLYGYTAEEAIGRPVSMLYPPEYDGGAELLERLQRGERVEQFETVRRRRDGSLIDVSITAVPVYDAAARLIGASAVAHDISQKKREAEEMLRAKEAAESANQAKSEFLANISHELRTPMNAILGMTDLALNEPLSPDVRECLETVKNSAEALLGLLNDVLDFSRMETGQFAVESIPFRLRSVLEEVTKVLAVGAYQKGLDLSLTVAPGVPDRLIGDPLRLRQILLNLVGNAVKFTEQGRIAVRVEVRSKDNKEACVEFAVSDTGIGISKEQQKRIFSPFTQVDGSNTRRHGGAGMGLAIVAQLTRLMGGEFWVESEEGQGSTFFFTVRLPRWQAAASSRDFPEVAQRLEFAGQTPPNGGLQESLSAMGHLADGQDDANNIEQRRSRALQILLVEDTLANQKLVQSILVKRGHLVEVASNGREAVNLVRHREFDLVLMDVQMPIMDGFQATAAIRAMEPDGKASVPVVAMTARAMRGDREQCLRSGMDAYIAKPVDSRRLLAVVEWLARRPRIAEGRWIPPDYSSFDFHNFEQQRTAGP